MGRDSIYIFKKQTACLEVSAANDTSAGRACGPAWGLLRAAETSTVFYSGHGDVM